MENMQSSFMPAPPQAITTKDIMYLKDALSWELLATKKFHFLAQQTQDQEIKQALDQAGRMHQQHYQKILGHLQTNNNAVMSNIQNQTQH